MPDAPERADPKPRRSATGIWYSPTSLAKGLWLRPRFYVSIAAASAVLAFAPPALTGSAHAASAWLVGATTYIAMSIRIMRSHDATRIRQLAGLEDETRTVFFALILLAIASSIVSVVGLIGESSSASGTTKIVVLALAGSAIFTAWIVMQIDFAFHYAHEFYRAQSPDRPGSGGLSFPGDELPDYWDFFYFTTSIGAASQTSDVTIKSKPMRRIATVQAILSFVFNTTIVALAINLAASLK